MKIKYAGKTDIGMKRSHNEDALFFLEDQHLFMVADGMGGHSSGEVASRLAVETIANFFKATRGDDEITWPYKMEKGRKYDENRLVVAIKLANQRIFEAAQRELRYKGMGTTIVSTLYGEGEVFVAHVGDSRVYLVRDGHMNQLTEDHSLLNDYIRNRQLTPEEIENFPHKNVIVRALGMRDIVAVDVTTIVPKPNDIFLLCTDGLSGMIDDAAMTEIVKKNGELAKTVDDLVDGANKNGGQDNITVMLLQFQPD